VKNTRKTSQQYVVRYLAYDTTQNLGASHKKDTNLGKLLRRIFKKCYYVYKIYEVHCRYLVTLQNTGSNKRDGKHHIHVNYLLHTYSRFIPEGVAASQILLRDAQVFPQLFSYE
jgi:hypothetical protein